MEITTNMNAHVHECPCPSRKTFNSMLDISELFGAITQCSERGLITSASWAAEQLFSAQLSEGLDFESNSSRKTIQKIDAQFLYAKTLFENREYLRAAHILSKRDDNKGLFLYYYAKYLYIQSIRAFADHTSLSCVPPALGFSLTDMEDILLGLESIYENDAFLMYLYGVVCVDLKMMDKGREALIESLHIYPYNWSCWLALGEFCDKQTTFFEIAAQFTQSHALECWKIQILNDLQAPPDVVLVILNQLAQDLPQSNFVAVQRAVLYHNARDFDEAELLFEELQKNDPYLIDSMDLYSNVLYVRRNYAKLCDLAHQMSMTDRYRPETCVCIGNYYSMKGDRKKAIEAFSRAIQLDHNYSPAWTLLGHEYVDSCNPKAAVEVYRKAIDINPRDYRAWYGLGQAYDLLQLPSYSIYYHQRAIAIRPNDGRMWGALATSLEATGKYHEAIKCLKRVILSSDSSEPLDFGKCASLYAKLYDDTDNSKFEASAAFYYKKYLFEHAAFESSAGEYVEDARAFLYNFHEGRGEFEESEKYMALNHSHCSIAIDGSCALLLSGEFHVVKSDLIQSRVLITTDPN